MDGERLSITREEAADEGTVYVLPRFGDGRNMRTQALRIVKRAGILPWEHLFQNLRSTRVTELRRMQDRLLVSKWLGHSERVEDLHYMQVADADYPATSYASAESSASSAQKAAQHGAAAESTQSHQGETANVSSCESYGNAPAVFAVPDGASQCSTSQYARQESNL